MKKYLHTGNLILTGFAIMLLFMSYLVFRCTQNPSIMVSNTYYEDELKYQDLIDARTNTAPFDKQIILRKETDSVTLFIPSEINKKLTKASLLLYSLTDDNKDRTIEIIKNEPGVYHLDTREWPGGAFRLKLSINTTDQRFYKEFQYE